LEDTFCLLDLSSSNPFWTTFLKSFTVTLTPAFLGSTLSGRLRTWARSSSSMHVAEVYQQKRYLIDVEATLMELKNGQLITFRFRYLRIFLSLKIAEWMDKRILNNRRRSTFSYSRGILSFLIFIWRCIRCWCFFFGNLSENNNRKII